MADLKELYEKLNLLYEHSEVHKSEYDKYRYGYVFSGNLTSTW
jgi:hypothetical protein